MKTTHTNRGTCQACGHAHAVDNVSQLVAKHGYTVDFGYFNGTCQGSDNKPAEHDVTITTRVIAYCTQMAASYAETAAALKDGTKVPTTFLRWNSTKVVQKRSTRGQVYQTTGGDDELPIAQATVEERAKAIMLAIHNNELRASGFRDHATNLTTHVLPRFGRELLPTEAVVKADVATAKAAALVGVRFPTKASRKDALDKLNRKFDLLIRDLQNLYLALPDAERTEAKTAVYYGASGLCNWRAKHSAAALREFPAAAAIVTAIEALVAERNEIKAAP